MNENYMRGDIYYGDLSPVIGSEQGSYRPLIVIQNDKGNEYSPTVIVAAVTSRLGTKARLPVHVKLPKETGLPQDSIALLEQIRTVDKRRLDKYVGHLDETIMNRIDEALGISVGLRKLPNWDNAMLLCLCSSCANEFYNTPGHYIKRADMKQSVKDTCTRCNVRQGYDFLIVKK